MNHEDRLRLIEGSRVSSAGKRYLIRRRRDFRLRFLSGEEARALVDACGKTIGGKAIKDLHLARGPG